MTDDNVIPLPTKYRRSASAGDSATTADAENRVRRRQAAAALEKRIQEKRTLQKGRLRLAQRLGDYYDAMKANGRLRGRIGEVFKNAGLARDDNSPSKQLHRYVRPSGKRSDTAEKDLSPNLVNYRKLAEAFAIELQRDKDEVVIEVFQGIFDERGDGEGWIEAEGLYDQVARRLNIMCTGIAQKRGLEAAFGAVAGWALGADWTLSPFFCRFHPDNFPRNAWIDDDDAGKLDAMAPSVPLYEWSAAVPVQATLQGEPADGIVLVEPKIWMNNADTHGIAPTALDIRHVVRLAIIPDASGIPEPTLLERYHVQIGDVPIKDLRSIGDGWFTFCWPAPDGTPETNALRLDDTRAFPPDSGWTSRLLVDASATYAAFRLRRVTPATLADTFSCAEAEIAANSLSVGPADRELVDMDEDRVLPSHAPSRTVAACLERRLAYPLDSGRTGDMLDAQAVAFCRKLQEYQTGMSAAYEAAAESALEQWTRISEERGQHEFE